MLVGRGVGGGDDKPMKREEPLFCVSRSTSVLEHTAPLCAHNLEKKNWRIRNIEIKYKTVRKLALIIE